MSKFEKQQKIVNELVYEYIDEIDRYYESRFYFVGVVMCIVVLWLMWLTYS